MKHYSIYYMMTPRCLLNCGYCFRDTSIKSIESELKTEEILMAISAMYHQLGVRKLTLSGGEPTFLGGVFLTEFLKVIDYLRQFKHPKMEDNLRIELLTNAVILDETVMDKLVGVVDRMTITLDSINEGILTKIGRNFGKYHHYVDRFTSRFASLAQRGFELKIHTVITPVNYEGITDLVKFILNKQSQFRISKWKFYQYMTYNDPSKDLIYEISDELYKKKTEEIEALCQGSGIELSFKDNQVMQDSMVSLTHFGKVEGFYMNEGIRTRVLSKPIWEYDNMTQLIADLKAEVGLFNLYHQLEY